MNAKYLILLLFLAGCDAYPSDYLTIKPKPLNGRSINVNIIQDPNNNCIFAMEKQGQPETRIRAAVIGCKRQ